MDDASIHARPFKRARLSLTPSTSRSGSSTPRPTPSNAALLLHLPKQLIHPPTHALHPVSLHLGLQALRRVLKLGVKELTPEHEARALVGIVELGVSVVRGGFDVKEEHRGWAGGIRREVTQSLTRALHLTSTSPSLKLYHPHLVLLQARFSLNTNPANTRYARNILRKLLGSVLAPSSGYLRHIAYTVYLAVIDDCLQDRPDQAIAYVDEMRKLAEKNGDAVVVVYCTALHLRLLFLTANFELIHSALQHAESACSALSPPQKSTSKLKSPERLQTPVNTNPASGMPTPSKTPSVHGRASSSASDDGDGEEDGQENVDPEAEKQRSLAQELETRHPFLMSSLRVHVLLLGVMYWTELGHTRNCTTRLDILHALLDAGALPSTGMTSDALDGRGREGVVEIPLSHPDPEDSKEQNKPLFVTLTPPALLVQLAYLVSADAKRDALGRTPKRLLFASEGLKSLTKLLARGIKVSAFADVRTYEEMEREVVGMRVGVMGEVVCVSIQRSEFARARETLDGMVRLALEWEERCGVWTACAAQITLHRAHLLHALGRSEDALAAYRVARGLARGELDPRPAVGDVVDVGEVQVKREEADTDLKMDMDGLPETPTLNPNPKKRKRDIEDVDALPLLGNVDKTAFVTPTKTKKKKDKMRVFDITPTPTPSLSAKKRRRATGGVFGLLTPTPTGRNKRRRVGEADEEEADEEDMEEWPTDPLVELYAGVGEVVLRLGVLRRREVELRERSFENEGVEGEVDGDVEREEMAEELEDLKVEVRELVALCDEIAPPIVVPERERKRPRKDRRDREEEGDRDAGSEDEDEHGEEEEEEEEDSEDEVEALTKDVESSPPGPRVNVEIMRLMLKAVGCFCAMGLSASASSSESGGGAEKRRGKRRRISVSSSLYGDVVDEVADVMDDGNVWGGSDDDEYENEDEDEDEDGGERRTGEDDDDERERASLEAKAHLRSLLQLTKSNSDAGCADTYVRTVVLGLVASFYVYTAEEHAASMLNTCDVLASGLGAAPSKSKSKSKQRDKEKKEDEPLGNVPVRLWIGERMLELAKRGNADGDGSGSGARVMRQERLNAVLRARMEGLSEFGEGMRREGTVVG